jgi:hypothetical protein
MHAFIISILIIAFYMLFKYKLHKNTTSLCIEAKRIYWQSIRKIKTTIIEIIIISFILTIIIFISDYTFYYLTELIYA